MLSDDRGAYAQLEQSLVAPTGVLPTTTAIPMMEVMAPATLSEGYSFDVDINGETFSVKVPQGGVEEGQTFTIPMPMEASLQVGLPRVHIPVGHWRDGLWDCFKHGVCHNHIWNACCCCLIAAGQVASRLQLTWLGRPGSIAQTTGAFWILFYISIAYWVIYILLGFGIGDLETDISTTTIVVLVLRDLLFYAHLALAVVVIYNLRKHVRSKYAIPEHENCPTGCEDACCSLCCPCLTVAQMMRHTADYDTYHSSCCTETGVPSTVPSIM